MTKLRLALLLSAGLAYAALSHGLMLHAGDRPWAVAVLIAPALAALLAIATAKRHLPAAFAALAALGVLAVLAVIGDVTWLYLAQHAGIHLALGASFAYTLRRGGQPAISAIAARVHGHLSAPMRRYTRRVTTVWASYFLAMAALSVLMYAALPWSVWSLYANLITPLCMAVLFVSEHLLRYLLHPEFERASLLDALRASGAASEAPSR